MFNPTNLYEVCFQDTHIESKGKNTYDDFSSTESNHLKEGKDKGKRKHTTTMKKEDTKCHVPVPPIGEEDATHGVNHAD